MFLGGEHMFAGLEHVFMGLELMFNDLEYKITRDVRKKAFYYK